MRRLFAAAAAVGVIGVPPAVALARGAHHHVTLAITGAQTSATAPVTSGTAVIKYSVKVKGSQGTGHGTFVTTEESLLSGATRGTVKLAHGSITSAGSYTVAQFAATGSVKLTTEGSFTHGTGSFAGISGQYSGKGSLNLSTGVLKLHIHGTSHY